MTDKRVETLEAEIQTLHQTLQVRPRMRTRAAAPRPAACEKARARFGLPPPSDTACPGTPAARDDGRTGTRARSQPVECPLVRGDDLDDRPLTPHAQMPVHCVPSAQKMGKNSTMSKDIFGREFVVPVDKEHKATECGCHTLFVTANPHMRAFHVSWFGFFASFYSTFAAASLNAYMIPDLNLNEGEWALGNTLAICGTIFFRVVMGWICDKFGARRGLGYLLLATSPACVLMMFINSGWQMILLRTIIGFSLATFVACQTWCSQMFAKSVVGIANATAAGWGNLGGGVTNLTMPLVFLLMMSFTGNNESLSWRLCYIVPTLLHLVGGFVTLTARDLPDGNFQQLEKVGAKQPSKSSTILAVGCSNVNCWIMVLTYGMCFGVELAMNNAASKYFYQYQGFTPQIAGLCASMWGLMNLFARSLGGWISDVSAKHYGIRGRLWSCWIVQTLEGIFCVLLGAVTMAYDAPHKTSVGLNTVEAWTNLGDNPIRAQVGLPNGWVNLNATCYGKTTAPLTLGACNTLTYKMDDGMRDCLKLGNDVVSILRQTAPPTAGGPAYNCVSNSGTAAVVMIIVVFFSLCVQAAEGLHYGLVPYICRPALGVVSGMIGAGGNLGGVIASSIFFSGNFRTDAGIQNLGWMIIAETLLLWFVYYEGDQGGGMFVPANYFTNYSPQIVKPPDNYTGADVMDYSKAAENLKKGEGDVPVEVAAA